MIFFVTGASGAGKSACLPGLSELLPDLAVHDFDELGVPADADKVWRQRTTEAWLARALGNDLAGRSTVICGGAVLGEILACPSAPAAARLAVCFLDCADLTRIERMKARGAGAATQDTLNWAAWQRVHVVDPQWRPDVITANCAGEMRFQRWADWQRGDARWRVHVLETSLLTVPQVSGEVAAWIVARMARAGVTLCL